MHNIDLNLITEEHVQGTWEVRNRLVNPTSEGHLFSDVRIIDILSDHYRSINGRERTGKWCVVREQEIIYNPQLYFYIDGQEVGNAIITRLLNERDSTGEVSRLTLYFNTGLELMLQRNDS